MDDGSLLRGEEARADAWREVVVHRAQTHASSDRSLPLWALLVAIAIHIAIFIALRSEIARRATVESTAIAVQMIDLVPAPPPPAEIPPAPVPAPITHAAPRVMRAPTPMSEPPFTATPETATPTLHLYNADGSLALPSTAAQRSDAVVARLLDAPPVADNTIMTHIRPLKVRPNHFDAAWEGKHGGNPLDRFVADHLTKSTGVMRMPWGTRVQCAWIMIVAGCAWGPADYWHGDQSWKPATELDEK